MRSKRVLNLPTSWVSCDRILSFLSTSSSRRYRGDETSSLGHHHSPSHSRLGQQTELREEGQLLSRKTRRRILDKGPLPSHLPVNFASSGQRRSHFFSPLCRGAALSFQEQKDYQRRVKDKRNAVSAKLGSVKATLSARRDTVAYSILLLHDHISSSNQAEFTKPCRPIEYLHHHTINLPPPRTPTIHPPLPRAPHDPRPRTRPPSTE